MAGVEEADCEDVALSSPAWVTTVAALALLLVTRMVEAGGGEAGAGVAAGGGGGEAAAAARRRRRVGGGVACEAGACEEALSSPLSLRAALATSLKGHGEGGREGNGGKNTGPANISASNMTLTTQHIKYKI